MKFIRFARHLSSLPTKRCIAGLVLLVTAGWIGLRHGDSGRASGAVPARVPEAQAAPVPGPTPEALPAGISQAWWTEARREIEAGQGGFAPRPAGGGQGWVLEHAGAGLKGSLDADGYTLEPLQGGWRFRLALKAMGREGGMRPVADVVPEASGGRVRYRRDAVDEWYRNVPEGIEQGFDVASRPEGTGPLIIEQALESSLALKSASPEGLVFEDGGLEVLSYRDLKAFDAGGRSLKAWMAPGEGVLRLVVEDAGAVYPVRIDPLSTTAQVIESNLASALLGVSVAYAGDVNGDGYGDVVVGASGVVNGQTGEGRAYVFHGSSTGLLATAAWEHEENQSTSTFGYSVAGAGDVDGDGYSDVIIGAYQWTNVETKEGRAFVYHGAAAGLSTTANWTAEADQSTASFGYSVAGAGDVNGDGYADVVVGAYQYENGGGADSGEGRAFVFHGSSTGLLAAAAWTWEPDQGNAQCGWCVAGVGDVDGDGYADVGVGVPNYDNGSSNEGRGYVFHGSSTAGHRDVAGGGQPGERLRGLGPGLGGRRGRGRV